jgi:hypothetical protein
MKRKSLLFGLLAVLSAVLIFTGCANPADGSDGAPGAAGVGTPGVEGPKGPIVLSAEQTPEGIQYAIDSGAPVVFAGVVQSENGVVTIPAGTTVTLVGNQAYSVKGSKTATLIVTDSAVISSASTGKIAKGSGTGLTVVAPQSVLSASVASDVTPVTIYNSFEEIEGTPTTVALVGPVTISDEDSGGKNINVDDAEGVTTLLYVVGDLSVSEDLTLTPLHVTGKVTFTEEQTALKSVIAGSVESSEDITGASGADITVTGELKTTGTAEVKLAGAGKLTAGSLDLAGNLTAGTDTTAAVTVTGKAEIDGIVTNGAAASVFVFNGPTTIDTFTSGNAGTVIAGTGSVTIAKALTDTSTKTVIIKNSGGVTLTVANTIAANLVATKATIKGTSTNGVTIESDATDITLDTGTSIDVTAEGASIVAGGTTNKVTITGATLKPGTYTGTDGKLSLDDATEIEVANGGKIEVAGAGGDLVLTKTASKVVLKAGGTIDVKDAGGKFGEADQTDTKVTVAASSAPSTATKAKVAKVGTVWTVTTDGIGTNISVKENRIRLGTFALDFDGTSEVNEDACIASTAESATAAAGKLITGAGTVITFIGTD